MMILRPILATLACFISLFWALPQPAIGAWRVIPIRIDFDQKTRSGVVTLNNDGEEAVSFTVDAAEWSQDESGQDVYSPTADLTFFPKQLTIPPNQERVVRAGIKAPGGTREMTYRLFIKEVAKPNQTEETAVAVAIQFGVPIFAKPVREEAKGELTPAITADGQQLDITVANPGNVHFRISTIAISGKDATGKGILSQELSGWYLLAGAARTYTAPLPAEVCRQLKTIEIQVNADRTTLNGKIDVDPAKCAAK
jgi:fimbrial chaperone protein